MRLWHYEIIPFLPNSQLIAQWRELNSVFKKQDKHILINYVYEYPEKDLYQYSLLVMKELRNRGSKRLNTDKFYNYFKHDYSLPHPEEPLFYNHHTDRYLLQCFYNLQEKFDRGQKDFSKEQYEKLKEFVGEKGLI